ncbi:MAG: ABC transporter substrate-binding protein [Promethearchaeota archaeon]|nr:MAG: ABC transporter substrate-binding protein [Candidatus Lokiarchaeota archaeon]
MRKKVIIILSLIIFLTIPMFQDLKWAINTSDCYSDNNIKIASPEEFNLTRAMYGSPLAIDPVDAWEGPSSMVIRQVAETLWFYNWSDPALPLINMLTESETWKNSTALEVTLRQGVLFHDGTPFNASVAKWNIERMLYLFNHTGTLPSGEPGSSHVIFESPDGLPLLAGFEVTGTYTGIIHLTQPFTSLMDLFCSVPASIISPTAHAGHNASFINIATDDLIGTGPYMYDYYITDTEVKFSRWDNYWREPVLFENMLYKISDYVTLNYMMQNGDVDYLSDIHVAFIDAFIADPDIIYDASDTPGLNFMYLAFNNKQINITWRKAMAYAFNYTWLIGDYYQDTKYRSYGPVSPGFGEWYTSEVEMIAPYLNLTIARQTLIDDPGIDTTGLTANDDPNDDAWIVADLATFNYSYPIGNYRQDLYVKLVEWFDRIGITVLDGGTDGAYFLNRVYGNVPGGYDDLQMFWFGWGPDYLDPINMIQPLFSNISNANGAQVNDSYLEAMFIQHLNETNHALKVEIIHNISKYIASELYAHIYTQHPMVQTCHSTEIFDVPYELNRYTFYAYPIKTTLPFCPQISSSGDTVFLVGETGHEISWNLNASELYDPMYSVYRDTTHLLTNPWGFDESINVSLDALPVGQYSYKIVVQNGPYSIENYVNVEVGALLDISHPPDITYTQGDTGNVISWVVNEGYEQGAIYYIYNESDTLMDSDTWDIGIPITFNVDGLSVGIHTFRIEVYNTLEYVEDTVGVEVKEQIIPGFPLLILVGLASIALIYIGIKSKHKLN